MAMEYPEMLRIAEQMRALLLGRAIERVELRDTGAAVYRWGFCNLPVVNVAGRTIRAVDHVGSEVHLRMNGLNLRFGAMHGRISYVEPGMQFPEKFKARFVLDTGASLLYLPTLYGYCQALTDEELAQKREAAGVLPHSPEFTPSYLRRVLDVHERKVAKQMDVDFTALKVAGVGNAYWHDVLYLSGVLPTRKCSEIDDREIESLYENTLRVIDEAVSKEGSESEYDLIGMRGSYVHPVGQRTAGNECPRCAERIEKRQILGSASYYCPGCQK